MAEPAFAAPVMGQPLADRLDAILPQTQCGQCGYHGCRPYAEAMAADLAPLNRCPPGGAAGIAKLAALLEREVLSLDARYGEEKPRQLARIIEADCIGCTKCIQVCPVDAIIGAGQLMHTVLRDDCTGCELCLPACPVDCIELSPMPAGQQDRIHADAARGHFRRRESRLTRECARREAELTERKRHLAAASASLNPVQAALARARERNSKPSS